MSGKMARSRDQTSLGTAGTPKALRSPPMASREPRRLLSSTPFPEFIWGISVQALVADHLHTLLRRAIT
jgi:hypothetical protein